MVGAAIIKDYANAYEINEWLSLLRGTFPETTDPLHNRALRATRRTSGDGGRRAGDPRRSHY